MGRFLMRTMPPLALGGAMVTGVTRSRFPCRISGQDFRAGFWDPKYLDTSPHSGRVSGSNLRENVFYVHTIYLGVFPCPIHPYTVPIDTNPKV